MSRQFQAFKINGAALCALNIHDLKDPLHLSSDEINSFQFLFNMLVRGKLQPNLKVTHVLECGRLEKHDLLCRWSYVWCCSVKAEWWMRSIKNRSVFRKNYPIQIKITVSVWTHTLENAVAAAARCESSRWTTKTLNASSAGLCSIWTTHWVLNSMNCLIRVSFAEICGWARGKIQVRIRRRMCWNVSIVFLWGNVFLLKNLRIRFVLHCGNAADPSFTRNVQYSHLNCEPHNFRFTCLQAFQFIEKVQRSKQHVTHRNYFSSRSTQGNCPTLFFSNSSPNRTWVLRYIQNVGELTHKFWTKIADWSIFILFQRHKWNFYDNAKIKKQTWKFPLLVSLLRTVQKYLNWRCCKRP